MKKIILLFLFFFLIFSSTVFAQGFDPNIYTCKDFVQSYSNDSGSVALQTLWAWGFLTFKDESLMSLNSDMLKSLANDLNESCSQNLNTSFVEFIRKYFTFKYVRSSKNGEDVAIFNPKQYTCKAFLTSLDANDTTSDDLVGYALIWGLGYTAAYRPDEVDVVDDQSAGTLAGFMKNLVCKDPNESFYDSLHELYNKLEKK
ncbi:MAG TPA: hypothetical protein ENO30_03895 [Thermodesulfobium narugense]|uniref:Uncharacterized protein n=1 Tax=Thermodesulfobium acidiphilum TaxID=1794699 RepID=A0A2R4W349_THEAF|nr:hypothetical protein [Thermodesulfobium acidiphilum]AWB11092.1 hypothetical protein TDSAC_1756 [Thermodesulfobium acidiphilum]HEM55887.1 hypothetical protein [Thermodesulfobium narugense]